MIVDACELNQNAGSDTTVVGGQRSNSRRQEGPPTKPSRPSMPNPFASHLPTSHQYTDNGIPTLYPTHDGSGYTYYTTTNPAQTAHNSQPPAGASFKHTSGVPPTARAQPSTSNPQATFTADRRQTPTNTFGGTGTAPGFHNQPGPMYSQATPTRSQPAAPNVHPRQQQSQSVPRWQNFGQGYHPQGVPVLPTPSSDYQQTGFTRSSAPPSGQRREPAPSDMRSPMGRGQSNRPSPAFTGRGDSSLRQGQIPIRTGPPPGSRAPGMSAQQPVPRRTSSQVEEAGKHCSCTMII